jgi:gliding motility-associated-like protein
VSLGANGIYTLVVSAGSCTNSITQSVTVNALPTPTAGNNTPICAGSAVNFSGSASTSYTWSGPGAFTSNSQNPSIPSASATASGIYTLSVTNANGCINSATTSVTVNPIPVPTIGSNNPVCVNNTINLTSGGGTTYSWSGPNGFTSALQNPSVANAGTVNAGVYSVTVTALGCSNFTTVSVSVLTPTVTASNTGPYCLGFPIQLNSSSASTFTWTGPGGFTSNQQNPTTAASTAGMAGTYNLIVSIGSCTAASSTSVTINALPTPTASNSSPICDGSTLNLFGSSAVSYTWSGPSSFSSNSQNPSITSASTTASGIYTITVTDVNGCVNFATTNVTVNPIPVPQIGSNSPVCLNNAINLTSGGGTSYSWSGPNGFTSTLQNPSVANAGTVNAGVYSVTVTALGCSNFTTVSVSVLTPTTNASNTGPYCVNDNIQLNTLAASSYTWSGPGGFSSNLQNPLISSATTAMSGVYNLIVSIGSCTAATSTSVTVNALPTPTASNNSPICDGSILNLFGSSAVSYTWSGPSSFSSNSQNPSITSASTTASGIYTITVTDGNGCVNFATTNVTVNPIPVPQIGSNSPVCLNNAINLTSGGGTSYSWSGPNGFSSTLQNPSVAVAGTVDAGVYSVTVTSLGCSNFTTVSVSVLTPTTNASNTGPYCVNDNIQLNTLTASSYTWSGPAGFSSNQQNPLINSATVAMGGVYNLIASIGSCTAAASTTVVVNALPTPTASNNSAICDGTTLNLFGSSAVSYTWTGPLSFASNSQNPSITNATTTASGLYTITVTDVNGCVNFATTNVTVNPIPVPQIGSNSPVCLNNSINLTSGGGTSYAWSGPNGFTSGTQNPTVPGATTVNDGVYTVTVTALGCSNTATVNVSILTPTIAASNTGPYCAGAPIQLNTSSVTSYTWSGPGGFSSNAQNPSIAASTTGMSGVYNLLASIGSCTASASTSVTVNPLPSPLIISNSPVCEGTTITMAGTGGATYLWAGPSGFGGAVQASSVPSANMSNAGMYTLTVTDANGCINSTTYSVTVNPLPNAVAVGTTVCQNANAILTASGGNSYSWSGPNNFNAIGASATIPSAPLNSSGQYTVTVTSVYGCTSTAMANLNIVAAPTPSIQSNSPVCINGSINLTTQAGYNYAWTGPGGFISSVQNPSLAATTTALSGMYYLTMTDANNCSASTNVNVVVNPLPVPVISSTNKIGCAPLCVNFNVQSATQVSSAAWSLGNGSTGSGSTVSACYSAQGVHTVNASVTDANGCFNSATYTVQVTPQPIADFNFSPLKPIVNVDADVLFTDASHGNNITSWTWYFMNTSGAQSVQQNTHFLYENPGEYVVALVVKNEFGCTDTMLKPITVSEDFGIYVPNAFTPNGDGVNDTFQPKGFGIEKYEMQIYDRWGEKVFETTEFEKGWDGSYMKRSETSSKDDSYIWRIKATSVFGKAHEYTGHVTLIK